MNIAEATKQIKNAVQAYLSRDERGLFRIPFHMQRPIIMFGPPGVGKTAIVQQIASELDINFVSYSITHHTRQSALGLPFIEEETFGGQPYSVSEYTMSEIIASVYRAQEKSGVNQGILFLDEVNCVSETLAPAMLQFLQYKTFGMHALPEGWIIVTAGNPPEYNRAAREFDPAMMDRMKRIDIQPDLGVWQEYATAHGVHPAVTTFLESKPASFYKVQASVQGTRLVTARGWEDLSRILQAYEAEGILADEALVRQYLQDDQTAREFASYYELFQKYEDDYKVEEILRGKNIAASSQRARDAKFDERVALVGLVRDSLLTRVHHAIELEEALQYVRNDLVLSKEQMATLSYAQAATVAARYRDQLALATDVGTREKGQVGDRAAVKAERLRLLDTVISAIAHGGATTAKGPYDAAKTAFNAEVAEQHKDVENTLAALDNAFRFLDKTFGSDAQESLILVTKLSADRVLIKFVSEYGSEQFVKHNKDLLFTERGLELMKAVEALRAEEGLQAPAGPLYHVD